MQTFQEFFFTGYTFDASTCQARFEYSFDNIDSFVEIVTFSPSRVAYDPNTLDKALRIAWLIIGISYFKAYPYARINSKNLALIQEESEFLNTVYLHGLGENLYRNQLDPDLIGTFSSSAERSQANSNQSLTGTLVPIGGGKDSLTTAFLLKEAGICFETVTVGEYPFLEEQYATIGVPHHTITRSISPHLLELNREGSYNGHIPVSAIWSTLFTIQALLLGKSYIALSNESSANEESIIYKGLKINHQWSKSSEYESLFRELVHSTVHPQLTYFSFLRPFNEVQIVKLFLDKVPAQLRNNFTSCNRNFKLDNFDKKHRWCLECDKCAFVSIMLAAYLPRNEVVQIMGGDPFSSPVLQRSYAELTGNIGHKPFECVGTPEEVNHAINLADQAQYPELKTLLQTKFLANYGNTTHLDVYSPEQFTPLQAQAKNYLLSSVTK